MRTYLVLFVNKWNETVELGGETSRFVLEHMDARPELVAWGRVSDAMTIVLA